MEKKYKKYVAVMILCFLFGGFSLILYLIQVYSTIWQVELIPTARVVGLGPISAFNFLREPRMENFSRANHTDNNLTFPGQFNPNTSDQLLMLFSPFSIMFLFMGVTFVSSGFSIWNLIRENEIKFTKKTTIELFLLPEEKKVFDEIEKQGGALTQHEIVRSTGFTRLKVHRIIKKLEQKKLLTKQKYGMTNKIVLKK